MSRQQRQSCSSRWYVSALEIKHPILGEVTLRRSARARRISISVLRSGEVRLTTPINGNEAMALEFMESRVEQILRIRERYLAQDISQPKPLAKEEVEELRQRAKGYIPQRVAELSQQFGFHYGRVTLRAMRSKWGSCSGRDDLSLNVLLMSLPSHLIDFVILHELCHTIHHDHSKEFHALLNRLVGGRERELHREMKGYRCCF